MEKNNAPKRKIFLPLIALFLFIIPFLVYSNTLKNGFVFDDEAQILDNYYITDFRNIPRILSSAVWDFQRFGCYQTFYYRPMLHLTYLPIHFFFKTDPFYYHMASVLLHSFNAVALFFVTLIILGEKDRKSILISLLTSLIFSLHPINSEAVNWAASITELTLFLFFLLSLCFFILRMRYDRHSALCHALSLSFFVMALMSKETAVAIPFVLLSYYIFFSPPGRKSFRDILAWTRDNYVYLLILAVYMAVRAMILGKFLIKTDGHPLSAIILGILNVPALLFRNIFQMIMPVKLSLLHHYRADDNFVMASAAAFVFIPPAVLMFKGWLSGLGFRTPRTNPLIKLSLAIIFLFLLPTFVVFSSDFAVSERYCYVPSAGLALISAFILVSLLERFHRSKGLIIFLISLFSIASFLSSVYIRSRNAIWKDNLSVYTDAQNKNPVLPSVYKQLGHTYCAQGETEKCQEQFKTYHSLPDCQDNDLCMKQGFDDYQLGLAYYKKGAWDSSIEKMREAEQSSFSCSVVFNYLGLAYLEKGQASTGSAYLAYAHRIDSKNELIRQNLSLIGSLSSKNLQSPGIDLFSYGLVPESHFLNSQCLPAKKHFRNGFTGQGVYIKQY